MVAVALDHYRSQVHYKYSYFYHALTYLLVEHERLLLIFNKHLNKHYLGL